MTVFQENKICQVHTDQSSDQFLVKELKGTEGISELFRFEMSLVSGQTDVDFKEIIGKSMFVVIDVEEGRPRYINGVVSRFRQIDNPDIPLEEAETKGLYWVEIVPWLWFLTRRQDCRIFQTKTVPDIVKEVFENLGFSEFDFRLSGSYDPLVNCVQYQETDFNFVSRLLEGAGIHYFFEHDESGHKLVLADSAKENVLLEGHAEAFYTTGAQTEGSEYRVHSWKVEEVLQPGKHALTDYNFFDPGTDLLVNTANTLGQHDADKYEIFQYPSGVVNLGGEEDAKLAKGEAKVKLVQEESEARAIVANGFSNCRAFQPGFMFGLDGHPRSDFNQEWLLTRVSHELDQAAALGQNVDKPVRYQNRITCIPHKVPFRPARSTPRPRILGVQTATVVGPSGEEIYVDKHGRVKVQFCWDRYGQSDENSSCWVRVSQNWAGKQWGILFHPRLGQEVVVEFLDGDPDRPLVTGRVYNAVQPIPFETPTQSGILTRSSKDGTAENFNQIRFEDQKDSEEIYVHAEKDMKRIVENNDGEDVGGAQTSNVGKSKSVTVGSDHQEKIGESMTLNVGKNRAVSVGSDCSESVGGKQETSIGKNYSESVGAARSVSVSKANATTVGKSDTTTVGASSTLDVSDDRTVNVGKGMTIKVGKNTSFETGDGFVIKAKKVAIEAKDELKIKVGSAELVMKKNGDINLKGKKINVKGSGDVIIKGSKIAQN